MWFDVPAGRVTLMCVPVLVVVLAIRWFIVDTAKALAEEP